MCRLAAFTGQPIELSSLLFDPPHSLQEQAYRPRELIHGTVSVDGTGVAWWDDTSDVPLRYVTAAAPWQDANLEGLAGRLTGSTVLAAVRSATPGIPIGPANVAPFVADEFAAVHNGFIRGFRGPLGKQIVTSLDDEVYKHLDTISDSKALFLNVLSAYEGSLEIAMRTALADIERLVRDTGTVATLNLVVAHRNEIVAARHSVSAEVNSLYVAATEKGHWIASEPLDESAAWKPVPEHHLVRITPDAIAITALEDS